MDSLARPGGTAPEGNSFGAELRRMRQAAGMSLGRLAAAANYSKSQLSKVENGVARPHHDLARACDLALGTGDALRRLLPGPREDGRRSRPRTEGFFSGLPRETPHFTGREDELTRVVDLLAPPVRPGPSPRICVLHGMPGVGKTALAVRAAHRLRPLFSDGCMFIDLHGYTPQMRPVPAMDALDRCLRRLGVSGEHIPRHVDDRAGLLRDRLANRDMLLILDNAAEAAQVEPLLPATAACAVLITSRGRLAALDDADRVGVDALSVDDAITLFRSVNSTGVADPTVDLIVRRCGLLPLTIRVAAARFADHPDAELAAFAERLATDGASRLSELDDGERAVLDMFEPSVRTLTPPQRAAFTALARHPGADFDVPAVAAMTGTTRSAADAALDRLADAHLLMRGPDRRFRFHDLLREYAVGLSASRDLEAPRRLADFYATTARRADRRIAPHRYHPPPGPARSADGGPEIALDTRDAAVRWMTTEFDNLVAVCRLSGELGLDEHCWRIAHALQGFSFLTKTWDAWRSAHSTGLAAARRIGDGEAEGYLLNGLGLVHLERHEVDRAVESFRTAYARFEALGDERGLSNTTGNWAWVHHHLGDYEEALRAHHRALRFQVRAGTPVAAAVILRGIAVAEVGLGRFDAAVGHLTEALSTFDEHDLPFDRAMALNCLGETHQHRGEPRPAAEAYRTAVETSRACGSRYELARALEGLASVADDRGTAVDCLEQAVSLYAELGAPEVSRVRLALGTAP
ncbi:ATP-binding protein [Streptomyces sp. NPDC002018]|uniref:ATP-binding protein n=1 Tax=Streptomyces sp. NPDC002018 TaxID=3364629 RepID=UPI00369D185A